MMLEDEGFLADEPLAGGGGMVRWLGRSGKWKGGRRGTPAGWR
jgi:hypothetical protein